MKFRWDTVFGLGLLVSFFLPWLKPILFLPGTVQGSGFSIANSPDIQGQFLYVVPALALLVVLTSVLPNFNNRWFRILAGFIPLGAVGWALNGMKNSMGSWALLFENLPVFVSWGLYIAITFSMLLFLNGVFGRAKPQIR